MVQTFDTEPSFFCLHCAFEYLSTELDSGYNPDNNQVVGICPNCGYFEFSLEDPEVEWNGKKWEA